MKKVFTFFIAFAVGSTVFAQTSRDEARRVILGEPKNSPGNSGNQYPSQQGRDIILGGGNNGTVYGGGNGSYPYPGNYPSGSSREAQIDQVNREYNAKIYSIRNNRYLSGYEKERMIRQLEIDRQRRIREINDRYRGYDDGRYAKNDRRYDRDDYGYKKDNGKHLGWEKGKGNPHKYGKK